MREQKQEQKTLHQNSNTFSPKSSVEDKCFKNVFEIGIWTFFVNGII